MSTKMRGTVGSPPQPTENNFEVAYVPRSKQPGAASAAAANPGALDNKSGPSILKNKSSFKGTEGAVGNKEKKLSFADEKGASLSTDVFCDKLYYSAASVKGSADPAGCCVIA